MRKQYHFKKVGEDILIWDVDKLIEASKNLPIIEVPLQSISEYYESYWYLNTGSEPTCKSVTEHAHLIKECNLDYPILLHSDGRVMDGMHRVCKAHLLGRTSIRARRFVSTPPHDFINLKEDELEY